MFGFFEKKKGEVIDHWYALVPGFNTSGKEFYEAIEKELKQSEAPGLEMFRVDFAEGGRRDAARRPNPRHPFGKSRLPPEHVPFRRFVQVIVKRLPQVGHVPLLHQNLREVRTP